MTNYSYQLKTLSSNTDQRSLELKYQKASVIPEKLSERIVNKI